MESNFNTALEELARRFIPAEINSDLTQAIKQKIVEANTILEQYDATKTQYTAYNTAYQRTLKYEEIMKNSKKLDVSNEVLDQMVDKATGFENYKESRLNSDLQTINSLYNEINDISKRGYETIMKLREMLTGQQIVYAIEHVEKGDISHQAFLDEEQYLELFNAGRGRDLKKNQSIRSPIKFAISLDTKSAAKNEGIDIANSKDWAYQMLAKFSEGLTEKGRVIKSNERWEMYTEVKSYFSSPPSQEAFNDYLIEFLATKHTWLKRLSTKGTVTSNTRNIMFKMSSLAFYQGGDSVYSDSILIQNKSTGAAVRVGTIYNALKTISSIFKDFPTIDAEKVKTMFTANLQDVPNQVVNAAFEKANKAAQDRVDEVLRYISR